MITVRKTENGFEPISGNPTLKSLDGKRKAPLRTILHASWTAEDRAKFGVYRVDPVEIPDGKRAAGQPRYEQHGKQVVQIVDIEDAPQQPIAKLGKFTEMQDQLKALAERVAALEAKA